MEKERIYKAEIVNLDKEKEVKTMWPFRSNSAQKGASLAVGLTGLLLVATTLNTEPPAGIPLGNLFVSYKLLGGIMFVLGLIYLIEAVSD